MEHFIATKVVIDKKASDLEKTKMLINLNSRIAIILFVSNNTPLNCSIVRSSAWACKLET